MYENENYNENFNGIYQTSASQPEMRLNLQPAPEKPAGRGAGLISENSWRP